MPHTIDEVYDLVQLVKDKVNEVKDKVQEVKSDVNLLTNPNKKFKYWADCWKCHSLGVVVDFGPDGIAYSDMRPPYPDPMPPNITCPLCNGAKIFQVGWLATLPDTGP